MLSGLWTDCESIGAQVKRRRRQIPMTLDELGAKTRISKPYLCLIENDRLKRPPSDAKLARLESVLGFPEGELVSQAHWHRTPPDVRELVRCLKRENARLRSLGREEKPPGGAHAFTSHTPQTSPPESA